EHGAFGHYLQIMKALYIEERLPSLTIRAEGGTQVNLDGEPLLATTLEVRTDARIDLLLPSDAPVLAKPHRPNSAVSIRVTLVNRTGRRLVRGARERSSGVYTVEPRGFIDPNEEHTFCIESKGIMTGAVGSVRYL